MTTDSRILVGDCLDVLRTLPEESVHCVVTSPPYWGLRDYGTATWEGGDPACAHRGRLKPRNDTTGAGIGHGRFGSTRGNQPGKRAYAVPVRDVCRCGARRLDAQLGLEPTPEEYVSTIVDVFREVRRVLRSDGTLWLNIGDSYAGSWGNYSGQNRGAGRQRKIARGSVAPNAAYDGLEEYRPAASHQLPGLKPKDLVMIPARVALALQADGWWVRSDIIWHKPNPMPESVTDRPTKAHEYLFLLTKSERYYYDAEAIREPLSAGAIARLSQPNIANQRGSARANGGGKTNGTMKAVVRTSGQKERKFRRDFGGVEGSRAHQGFGIPWASDGSYRPQYQRALELAEKHGLTERHLEAIRCCGFFGDSNTKTRLSQNGTENEDMLVLAREAKALLGGYYREFLQGEKRNRRSVWTITTKPFKGAHFAVMPPDLVEPCVLAGSPGGGVVLDPFAGAGTVGLVAQRLGRSFIGIELNPEYAAMARERIRGDSPLFATTEEPAA